MKLRSKQTKLIVGLSIVALGSVGFGTLSPSASSATTSITITASPKFSGQITSNDSRCLSGRTVKVKKVRNRRSWPPRSKKIGETGSTATGSWALPSSKTRGRYFARVTEVDLGTSYGYAATNCPKATSQRINL